MTIKRLSYQCNQILNLYGFWWKIILHSVSQPANEVGVPLFRSLSVTCLYPLDTGIHKKMTIRPPSLEGHLYFGWCYVALEAHTSAELMGACPLPKQQIYFAGIQMAAEDAWHAHHCRGKFHPPGKFCGSITMCHFVLYHVCLSKTEQ